MRFVSSTHAALATRVLTLPLMGLPPIEHICLFWTYTEAPSLRLRSGQALAFFARAGGDAGDALYFEPARRFCRPSGTRFQNL